MSTPQDPQLPPRNPDGTPVPPPPPAPPQFGEPQFGGPQFGAPQQGQPGYGQPPYGQPTPPQYGQPQQPQYGQPVPPEYGQPGQPAYGQPPYDQPPYGQPPYDGGQFGQQFGQPAAPAPKNRKTLWILLGVIAAVLVLVVVGVILLLSLVGNATNKAKGQAEEFTKLLVNGETEEAYDRFLSDTLKEKLSKAEFVRGIRGLDLDSDCKAAFTSVEAQSKDGVDEAEASGTLDCSGRIIELRYGFTGSDLKMDAIRVKPRK